MNEALWALGRGTGVVALVMFTITLVLGHRSAGRAGRSAGSAASVSTRCTAPPPSPASA